MNYILFDDYSWDNLLPLTFTRPVSEIRVGILTMTEKWKKFYDGEFSFLTNEYLSIKYPCIVKNNNFLINGSVFPNYNLCNIIKTLKQGEVLVSNDTILAASLGPD